MDPLIVVLDLGVGIPLAAGVLAWAVLRTHRLEPVPPSGARVATASEEA